MRNECIGGIVEMCVKRDCKVRGGDPPPPPPPKKTAKKTTRRDSDFDFLCKKAGDFTRRSMARVGELVLVEKANWAI